MRALVAPLTVVALATAAAPAGAAVRTFGSALAAPATLREAHPVDTAYWQQALPGATIRVPAEGQITSVRVRGFADSTSNRRLGDPTPPGGERDVFVQVLQKLRDGRYRVRRFGTGGPALLPGPRQGGDENTITTIRPKNLCAERGDAIALNTVGGFHASRYPQGTPLQVFAATGGAVLSSFTRAGRTNNGQTLAPRKRQAGRELLLRATLATGSDAVGGCR